MDKERVYEIAAGLGRKYTDEWVLAFAAAIEREAFIAGAAAQREAAAGLCQLVSVSYTFDGAKETAEMCQHEVIQTWRLEDGKPVMWDCAECRLRFYPVSEEQLSNVEWVKENMEKKLG